MSSVDQQLAAMQEQMANLQAQLAQVINPTPMQAVDDTAPTQLHSLSTRPHYEWTPSEAQVNLMHMDVPIHTSKPMSTVDRKAIIEAYPPVAQLEYYRSPATVPSAEKNMNRGQKIEDNSLKHLQYQASAILRPLDVLAHEMLTQEPNTPNLERFCAMLSDMRSLVVDLCSTITQARVNIAYRTIDPSFSVKTESDVGYIVPLDEFFQQSISQHAAAKKALREASSLRRPRRRYPNGNFGSGTFSSGPSQQFFRSGPPSQQGGLHNNNTSNFNNNTSSFSNNNTNSSNNFRQENNNTKKSSNNPFLRQQ